MKITQEIISIVLADDGKVLRRKSDGKILGETRHLGYNYYDADILLKNPYLSKPEDFEEVDKIVETDENGQEILTLPKDDYFKRLSRMVELIEIEKKQIQDYTLTAPEMLVLKSLYPIWLDDLKVGDKVIKGTIFNFQGKLYVVLKDHTILPYYYPNNDTASLYEEITPDYLPIK